MEFAIVEFVEDKSVAVVSTNWLTEDNLCCWPTKSIGIEKLVKERVQPGANWNKYAVRVLKKYGKFKL
jgi:hypothetical protein